MFIPFSWKPSGWFSLVEWVASMHTLQHIALHRPRFVLDFRNCKKAALSLTCHGKHDSYRKSITADLTCGFLFLQHFCVRCRELEVWRWTGTTMSLNIVIIFFCDLKIYSFYIFLQTLSSSSWALVNKVVLEVADNSLTRFSSPSAQDTCIYWKVSCILL